MGEEEQSYEPISAASQKAAPKKEFGKKLAEGTKLPRCMFILRDG